MRSLAPLALLPLAACAPRASRPPPPHASAEEARLAGLAPEVRAAVREHRVAKGMTPEEVRLAWGEPAAVVRSASAVAPGLGYERWRYTGSRGEPPREVWFAGGKVVDSTGPPGPPPAPPR